MKEDPRANPEKSSPFRERPFWKRHWQWGGIFFLTVLSFGLGFAGFRTHGINAGETRSVLDDLYLTLQLFTMNSGAVAGLVPWQLEAARFLAPLVPGWALVKALAVIFHEQLLSLRLRFTSGHVVICGLGRKGLQLAREFRAQGHAVVVVEIDEENPAIRSCRNIGALVMIGDACDKSVLRRARVFRADHVIAVCAKDGQNVEIAVLTNQLVHEHESVSANCVHCHVHIVDLKLCTLFKQHRVFHDTGDRFEASVVNLYTNVARSVFADHPLDRERVAPSDPRGVQLIVVGFGLAGEAIAVQAARIAHYANGKRLRLDVVDRRAKCKERSFLVRNPFFREICDLTFLEGDVEEQQTLEWIRAQAADTSALTTVFVSLGSDSRSITDALDILAAIDAASRIPILVRVAERSALASLFDTRSGAAKWVEYVEPVGMDSYVCSRAMLLNKELDTLARAIHEEYLARRMAEGGLGNAPSLLPWGQLDQIRKDSNRQQADHIPIKLRAIGCHTVALDAAPQGPPFAFSEAETELLARMEYARWRAYRFLTGWTHGQEKDFERKTSPFLADWDTLPETMRERNREPVRNIPRLLRLVGLRVQRDTEAS